MYASHKMIRLSVNNVGSFLFRDIYSLFNGGDLNVNY